MNFSFNVSRHLHHWLTDRILWKPLERFPERSRVLVSELREHRALPSFFFLRNYFSPNLYNSFMLEHLVHTSPPIFWLHFTKSHLEHRVIPVNELLLNDSTDTALSKYLACYCCLLQLLLDNIITTFLGLFYILTRKI